MLKVTHTQSRLPVRIYGPTVIALRLHVSVRPCIVARLCAEPVPRKNVPGYWPHWNVVTWMGLSFFSDRCFKKGMHRGWASFQARLACTMAAFHVLVQWHGFQPNASGFVPLSMAGFSL